MTESGPVSDPISGTITTYFACFESSQKIIVRESVEICFLFYLDRLLILVMTGAALAHVNEYTDEFSGYRSADNGVSPSQSVDETRGDENSEMDISSTNN